LALIGNVGDQEDAALAVAAIFDELHFFRGQRSGVGGDALVKVAAPEFGHPQLLRDQVEKRRLGAVGGNGEVRRRRGIDAPVNARRQRRALAPSRKRRIQRAHRFPPDDPVDEAKALALLELDHGVGSQRTELAIDGKALQLQVCIKKRLLDPLNRRPLGTFGKSVGALQALFQNLIAGKAWGCQWHGRPRDCSACRGVNRPFATTSRGGLVALFTIPCEDARQGVPRI
jgi:hypothetical protein